MAAGHGKLYGSDRIGRSWRTIIAGEIKMEHAISIKRAVLHVLDLNAGIPAISKGELEVSEELENYLARHIDRVLDDPNTKGAFFASEDNNMRYLCSMIKDNEEDFLPITADIADKFFTFMQKNPDIPSADLVCCIAQIEGAAWLCILKLNYKAGFTHWVNNFEAGCVNTIIRHQTLLPQEGQKLDECVLVNLEDMSIKIIEKQYEINGEKEFYLSGHLFRCICGLSDNAKLRIIDKVTKNLNKKYFDEDFEKAVRLKKAVSESFEETAAIRIDHIADKVFEKNLDVKREYVEEIARAGIIEKEIQIPDKIIEKKFKTHRIKTDTGIEIDFPLEYTDDPDRIEFINNPDGTLSILIKNVTKITNR